MSNNAVNAALAKKWGSGQLEPAAPIVAGTCGTWRLTYTAGERGLPAGSRIRIYTDTDTDWANPQFLDPAGEDFASVEVPAGVQYSVRTSGVRSLAVALGGRDLKPGEQVHVVLGETSGGSPGIRPQTFAESRHCFWFGITPSKGAGKEGHAAEIVLPDPPEVEITGDVPVRLVATIPSTLVAGQSFDVLVKAEDRWGNPSPGCTGTLQFNSDGVKGPSSVPLPRDFSGAGRFESFTAASPGTLRLRVVHQESGLEAISNPAEVLNEPAEHELCWADPHGGQLVLNRRIKDFYRYARDVAGVQFVGYQRNADVISEEDWSIQQDQEQAFFEPGRFIPIPGFEWSGRTPEGGHHNVYFRRHGQQARRNPAVERMFHAERAPAEIAHVRELYEAYRNQDVIITPHVGGEHSNLTWHDPTLEPAVEITSTHGMFEWMQRDALERNYRLGFLGGSDSYTGRPGDDRPGYQHRRYSKAGLTGIYVEDISLESFFEAMKARRVYATTGVRMILRLDADGQLMGSDHTTDTPPTFSGTAVGTAPIEAVELFRGTRLRHRVPLELERNPNRVRVQWAGGSRMTSYSGAIWEGRLVVEGAKLLNVETTRFDSPRSHIISQNDHEVRWYALGCGYPMSLILELDHPEQARLNISADTAVLAAPGFGRHGELPPRRVARAEAERVQMTVDVPGLQHGPQETAVGVLDRRLTVDLYPEDAPLACEFQWTETDPQPGVGPYWFRVKQTDGNFGWTSPVFVDYVAPE